MLTIPDNILTSFEAILNKRAVAPAQRADDKKWLRYFLDFCARHTVTAARLDYMRSFIDKLREKRQTPAHQEQAA
ncbi:MAG: integron integrase [Candidatus Brocadiaceae bacterium]|nr:integron integrase [Candidatus Brocadiaceae bacterium]